jgi:hypothetical protein
MTRIPENSPSVYALGGSHATQDPTAPLFESPCTFRKVGIEYVHAEKTRSELYLELLGPLNSGQVDLLDHPRLVAQLCTLERRTSRAGRDSGSLPLWRATAR